MPSFGSEIIANEIYPVLVNTEDFDIPNIDLSGITIPDYEAFDGAEPTMLTIEELTEGVVNGSGIFDKLATSISAHLAGQFEKQRITAKEYADVYIQLMSAAMQTAANFLTQRDTAYWQAISIMQSARLTEAQLAKAKADLAIAKIQAAQAQIEAHGAAVTYALTKLKLATEDASHELIVTQKAQVVAQTETIVYSNANILPVQKDGIVADTAGKVYNTSDILPTQKLLLLEQVEVQRAQTRETHSDASAIAGLVGSQKQLYAQQIVSYKRDAEVKFAKLYTDAWITMKTLDEGLSPPDAFTNATIDEILTQMQTNNDLD